MKRILITGANSYIGTSFENYVKENFSDKYSVDTVDLKDGSWRDKDFSGFDAVFHVAGIAHSDSGKISAEKEKLYRAVNTDLTIETAKKAKADGVKQFIFMSSAIVYGDSAKIGKRKVITANTEPCPANCYGDSKLQAEKGITELKDDNFKVCILRPPMTYGKNSRGNYPALRKLALKLPFFPFVKNERSMLYIGNLVEFVRLMVENEEDGIFFPQNAEYSDTSLLVKAIAEAHGKKIKLVKGFGWALKILSLFTGVVNKAFGNLTYDLALSEYKENYRKYDLGQSIDMTEKETAKRILVVTQYFYPEQFRINDICFELVKRGYDVTVLTGVPNYPEGRIYDGYRGGKKREEIINGVKIHRCFTIARRRGILFRFLNYYSFAISSKRYAKKTKERFDVVLVNQLSPVLMAEAGVAYKKKHGTKLVLYCLDLWPESLVAGGIKRGSLIYKHYHKVSEDIYENCDKILVTSKCFSDYFEKEFGIKDAEYLPQYAEDIFSPEMCKKIPDGYIDLMFAGNVGTIQSVDTIIESARLTKDIKNLRWHIVGDGSELERIKKSAEGLGNVYFYGKQPLEEMPKYYAMADAMLVTMINNPIISYTLPGKVQTYMAAGKPILGAIDGEAKRVIEESECGYCAKSEDTEDFVSLIKRFIEHSDKTILSWKATDYYKSNFFKEVFFDTLNKELSEDL